MLEVLIRADYITEEGDTGQVQIAVLADEDGYTLDFRAVDASDITERPINILLKRVELERALGYLAAEVAVTTATDDD